jgi:diguanylate cyclase (GGDEF)-like protein/PAS domain S-box-containing protein
MPSPVNRKTRRTAVVLFIVGSIFIVGSNLLGERSSRFSVLQNAPHLLASLLVSIGSCSLLACGLAMGILTYRFRKNRSLNWVAVVFGMFLLLEMLTRELDTQQFRTHHAWTIGVLKILSSMAALLTVLGLPSAIRHIEETIDQAARRRESELRLSAAAESSTDAILMLESISSASGEIVDFRFVFLNRKAASLFSKARTELIGIALYENFPEVYDSYRMGLYKQVAETGESLTFACAHTVFKHNDEDAHLNVHVEKLGDGIVITVTDVTDWHRANDDLKKALSFSKAVVDCSPFCTIVTDTKCIVTSINPAGERMLGYRAGDLLGRSVTLLHDAEEIERQAGELSSELGKTIKANHEVFRMLTETGTTDSREWTYIRKDGSRFPVHLSVTAVKDHEGCTIGFMGTSYDMTERKKAEEYIYYVAHHDTLTGLPTRTLLSDRLGVALERAKRSGEKVALMMVDLDHFKRVNDSLGHPSGDTLLCEVARRLKDCVRKSDTVARMGGDEFVVLLTDMRNTEDAEVIARKLQEALSQPIHLGRHNITVTASIGVSIFPVSEDADVLFNNADLAMYRVKARGRTGIEI